MDDEIEDLVGDVKYTDSQKSVATSNLYSMDFTDSSSDKNNSSGKDTYVIEWDDSDDSDKNFKSGKQSIINLKDKAATPIRVNHANVKCSSVNAISKSTTASIHKCSIAQEIFTQTSKTIIELAQNEASVAKTIENKTLETQTSFISISESKTVEYRIQVSGAQTTCRNHVQYEDLKNVGNNFYNITCNQVCNFMNTSIDDASSKFPVSETENERTDDFQSESESSSDDKVVTIVTDEESKEENKEDDSHENNSLCEKSLISDTDIDEDSLMCNEYNDSKNYNADNTSDTSEVPKSVDSDVEDLYKKLTEKVQHNIERSCEQEVSRFSTLTPLTEESTMKKESESILDITPDANNIANTTEEDKYVLFVNNDGIKIKTLPDSEITDTKQYDGENVKLPPIKTNQSCPSSPHLNYLFSENAMRPAHKNFFQEGGQREWSMGDRWEIGTRDLAAGESPLISGRSDPTKKLIEPIQLPPIHEGNLRQANGNVISNDAKHPNINSKKVIQYNKPHESINIKDKITELKISNNLRHWPQPRYTSTTESRTSRSASPGSPAPEDSGLGDVAERGCEALCQELLRRLRSNSWFEVSDTLEELPRVMEKFWGVVSENRIADLIRQVNCHVESPRTQVARSACNTLAAILKNTNYTKKPDFYEAVTSLLVKTGSFSRPVRRAANVALDGIVCGVELAHAVTALCVHGTDHKSPLVRCAAARLLVVCCALAGGGRELLRTRPPSAVCARRHALHSLAVLLEDKNSDTRKYAERLYSMLRPLSNFEAFYLTDVDVEVASRQMKKYDHLLLCGPPKEHR